MAAAILVDDLCTHFLSFNGGSQVGLWSVEVKYMVTEWYRLINGTSHLQKAFSHA